jgi:hypothetical protein
MGARSSAVEHCLDMAVVTGSIPVVPTIYKNNKYKGLGENLSPFLLALNSGFTSVDLGANASYACSAKLIKISPQAD